MRTEISFVHCHGNMRVVRSIDALEELLSECRTKHIPLEDIDLSYLDLHNINMGGVQIQNVIFNAFDVKHAEPKLIFNVNFKGSELLGVSFAHCKFIRCNFDVYEPKFVEEQNGFSVSPENNRAKITRIENADFFLCEFDLCRFRNTSLKVVDFRYSSFVDCSLGGCCVEYGDFYMAAFKGTTNFVGSKFVRCSITNAVFENNPLRFSSIKGLLQEFYEDYSNLIIGNSAWHKKNPCGDFSRLNKNKDEFKCKAFIRNEASAVYAQLSGYYAGKGFFRDSNKAYGRAKINEAWGNFYSIIGSLMPALNKLKCVYYILKPVFCILVFIVDMLKFILQHLGFLLKKVLETNIVKSVLSLFGFGFSWMFGFGYKIRAVFLWLAVIVSVYMFFLHHKAKEAALSCKVEDTVLPDEIEKPLTWKTELAYSLNNMIGPFEKFTDILKDDLAACLQTTSGILLIGFLGFVLANRIRNNY